MNSPETTHKYYGEYEETKLLQQFWDKIKQNSDQDIKNCIPILKDDDILLLIRARKYNVERAYDTLQRLLKCRNERYPETFDRMNPSRYERILRGRGMGVFKYRDSHGRATLYTRGKDWMASQDCLEDWVITYLLCGFESLKSKETQLNGVNCLADAKGFGFKQAAQVTPSLVGKIVDIVLHSSPVKIKSIHVTNPSRIFEMSLKVIKMFMPTKIRKRIHVHLNNESLLQHFPQEILPDWLGGLHDELQIKDHKLINNLLSEESEDWFQKLATLK